MQNYVGKQIDRYRIIERLGMGGMAVVYKAYDTRLEREVALKLIRSEAIPPEHYNRLMKRFEREAKSQARFTHRNIVPIYDYGEVDGSPYLVMAYISHGTLKDRLHGPVDWRQAVRWLIPVAEALAYAHKSGIVHRDIKPANILFDEESQPILTDFGIAKVLETEEATLTGTGFGVGTPEYMAPEQWQGKTNEATDQYALGVVLYELITGRKPYSADTPAAVAIMQATEPLTPPSGFVPDLPENLEKKLYKALALDQRDRYENMDEFANALRGLLTEAVTTEPIQSQTDAQNPEPTPTAQPPAASESVTRDELDVTPIEEMGTMSTSVTGKRQGYPKWAVWAGLGLIIILLIGLTISSGRNLMNKENDVSESKITQVTETADITVTPKPTLGVGSTMVNKIDDAIMVYVPAGGTLMGRNDGDINESPEHPVYLDAYWIGKYEVTNAQYRLCIMAENCTGNLSEYSDNQYPAVNINWSEASTYCTWAGGRLPTEAEWEKAARGADERTYPWGTISPSNRYANYYLNSGGTLPIGSFERGVSPYGAMDMAGNVWEWVADWYDPNYYEISPTKNPRGPKIGEFRVIRGGSWSSDISGLGVSVRGRMDPGLENLNGGFRCVIDNSK
jgi:serine/threonine-protein kinase